MKQHRFKLPCFFLLFLFVGCTTSPLVGTWKIVKFEVQTTPDFGMATEMEGKIIFQKNGTGDRHIGFGFSDVVENGSYPFTWKMQNKKLIISDTDAIFANTWEVVALTKNWCKLKAPYRQEGAQYMELEK